jgi:hypothetical protein
VLTSAAAERYAPCSLPPFLARPTPMRTTLCPGNVSAKPFHVALLLPSSEPRPFLDSFDATSPRWMTCDVSGLRVSQTASCWCSSRALHYACNTRAEHQFPAFFSDIRLCAPYPASGKAARTSDCCISATAACGAQSRPNFELRTDCTAHPDRTWSYKPGCLCAAILRALPLLFLSSPPILALLFSSLSSFLPHNPSAPTAKMDMGGMTPDAHACKVPLSRLTLHASALITCRTDLHALELLHHRLLLPYRTVAHPLRRYDLMHHARAGRCSRHAGAFAGTVIGVFLITALVEGVRRASREFDRRLVAEARSRAARSEVAGLTSSLDSKSGGVPCVACFCPCRACESAANIPFHYSTIRVVPTLPQQLIRASFFGIQFTVAYILMLLAMSYNSYIIMVRLHCACKSAPPLMVRMQAILLGGTAGYAVFSTDTLGEIEHDGGAACC